jgi:hypothetical protein
LAGIKTTKLDAAITTICTRDELRSDFDQSVDLLKTFIQEDKSTASYTIGTVLSDQGGGRDGGSGYHGGREREVVVDEAVVVVAVVEEVMEVDVELAVVEAGEGAEESMEQLPIATTRARSTLSSLLNNELSSISFVKLAILVVKSERSMP